MTVASLMHSDAATSAFRGAGPDRGGHLSLAVGQGGEALSGGALPLGRARIPDVGQQRAGDWLGVVALPLWSDDALQGATRTQAGSVLWVAILVAAPGSNEQQRISEPGALVKKGAR